MMWRDMTLCSLCLRLDEEIAEVSPIVLHWRSRRGARDFYRAKPVRYGRTRRYTRKTAQPDDDSLSRSSRDYSARLEERFRRRDEEIEALKRENAALKKSLKEIKKENIEQDVRHRTEIRTRDFMIQQLTRECLDLSRRIETIEQDLSDELPEKTTPEKSEAKNVASYPPTSVLDKKGLSSSEVHDDEWLHPSTQRKQAPSPEGSEHMKNQQLKLAKAMQTIRILRNQMKMVTDTKNKLIEDYQREIETIREERDQWEIDCLYRLSKTWDAANASRKQDEQGSTIAALKEVDKEHRDESSMDGRKPDYKTGSIEESKEEFHHMNKKRNDQSFQELESLGSESESFNDKNSMEEAIELLEESGEARQVNNDSSHTQDQENEDGGLEQLINEIAEVTREMEKDLRSSKLKS